MLYEPDFERNEFFILYDEWVRMEIQPDIQITEEQLYIYMETGRDSASCYPEYGVKKWRAGSWRGKKISIVLERDQNQAGA